MGDELKVRLLDASRDKLRRRTRIAAFAGCIAIIFAVIAGGAIYYWQRADDRLQQAQRSLDTTAAMVSSLVATAAETARSNPQVEKVEELRELILNAIKSYASGSGDPRIPERRARTYLALAEIDFER